MLKISITELWENGMLSNSNFNLLRFAGFTELSQIENFTFDQIYLLRNGTKARTREILKVIELVKGVHTKEELFQITVVKTLKNKAKELFNLNKKINSRKVTLLLNLALNDSCSYGELVNATQKAHNILAKNGCIA